MSRRLHVDTNLLFTAELFIHLILMVSLPQPIESMEDPIANLNEDLGGAKARATYEYLLSIADDPDVKDPSAS